MCISRWGNFCAFDWNNLPVGREFDGKFYNNVKSLLGGGGGGGGGGGREFYGKFYKNLKSLFPPPPPPFLPARWL